MRFRGPSSSAQPSRLASYSAPSIAGRKRDMREGIRSMSEMTRLIDDDGIVHFEPKQHNVGQGGRLGFLSADAWLDSDGYHVWCAHDCAGVRVVSMLPWPTWQSNVERKVCPSFFCEDCGTHVSLEINRRLDEGGHTFDE
jgi:hypothetical protein